MINVLIFLIHIIFIGYIFYKKNKNESLSAAFIDMALIIIVFSVGWSISTMLVKIVIEPEGFGKHFDRDAISLVLLTIGEYFFYKMYYKGINTTEVGKGK